MLTLELKFLGPPVVLVGGRPSTILHRKPAALLYYLAANPNQPLSRAQIISLLWDGYREPDARNSLSTALSRLHGAFDPAIQLPIFRVGDGLEWRLPPHVGTDLERFREAHHAYKRHAALDSLVSAVDCYRGEFLEGFEIPDSAPFGTWLSRERDNWKLHIQEVYRQLIDTLAAKSNYLEALWHAQRAIGIDPLSEPMHQLLMRLYAQTGDRAKSLAQYGMCERLLKETLGVAPSPATQAVRDAVLNGSHDLARPVPEANAALGLNVIQPSLSPHRDGALIGRTQELRRLWQMTVAQPDVRRRMIVIEGDAGIGKSRIFEEFIQQLSRPHGRPPGLESVANVSWTVLAGSAHPDAQKLAYHPIIEAIRGHLPSLALDRLDLPGSWLAEVNRLLPEIGAVCRDLPPLSSLDPRLETQRLYEGIAGIIASLPAPRVFALEDLQSSDTDTLRLIAYLLHHVALPDLRVVATVRQEDLSGPIADELASLEYDRQLQRLEIGPLCQESIGQLVDQIVGQLGDGQASGLGDWAFRESQGNPLDAIEMARSYLEDTTADRSNDPRFFESIAVPTSIGTRIRHRLARLDPASRDFLAAASVFQDGFDFDVVCQVAGQTEEVGLAAAESLLAGRLLTEVTGTVVTGVGKTQFRVAHHQIRRTVQETMTWIRVRLLHRRAFRALITKSARRPDMIAYHAYAGELWEEAFLWSEPAADRAFAAYAYPKAEQMLRQALKAADYLPVSADITRKTIACRLLLAKSLSATNPRAILDVLRPAEAEATALGDASLLTNVWLAQASACYVTGHYTEALLSIHLLNELLQLGKAADLRPRVQSLEAKVLLQQGELQRGLPAAGLAFHLLESSTTDTPGDSDRELLSLIAVASGAAAMVGDSALATRYLERGNRIARNSEDPFLGFLNSVAQAEFAVSRGDWTTVADLSRQILAQSEELGSPAQAFVARVFRGMYDIKNGDRRAGIEHLRRGIVAAHDWCGTWFLAQCYAALGRVLAEDGDFGSAYKTIQNGRDLSLSRGHLAAAALCNHALGDVYLLEGQHNQAAAALVDAHAILVAAGAMAEVARIDLSLSRIAADVPATGIIRSMSAANNRPRALPPAVMSGELVPCSTRE